MLRNWAARDWWISSSNIPTCAIWASAERATLGAMAAGNVRPAACARRAGRPMHRDRGRPKPMTVSQRLRAEDLLFSLRISPCIPVANWLILHVGTVCPPNGPCLIPVAPGGILAPSGVLMAGLALVLRDLVQRRLGVRYGLAAIGVELCSPRRWRQPRSSWLPPSRSLYLNWRISPSTHRCNAGALFWRSQPAALSDWSRTRCCSSGSRSVRWSF